MSLEINAASTSRQKKSGKLIEYNGAEIMNVNNKKQLAILFPIKDLYPIGGFKIAYQYADYFASIGYEVHLIYSHVRYNFFSRKISIFEKIKTRAGFTYKNFKNKYKAGEWYNFKNPVQKHFVFKFDENAFSFLNEDAIVFATAVETAIPLSQIKRIRIENKFYLIQDYELWDENTDELIQKSYSLGFKNIVIAQWLKNKVEEAGGAAEVIANGLDFKYFYLKNPVSNRKPFEVAMLYHKDERKRCQDSIEALKLVKEQIPELHVTMFGNPEKPDNLPEWFEYHKTPDHETHLGIYNNAAIFVAASNKEGWALPPAESMQCGCALVCTDIGGFADYAKNEETALTSPVYDVKKLSENIIRLVKDNAFRIKLAENGNNFIQRFTLEASFEKIRKAVEENN